MHHPNGHCQDCGERHIALTDDGTICANGHSVNPSDDDDDGQEHLLEETMGLFGTTVYECRHCDERSPDEEYFNEIDCPPNLNDI